MDRDVVQSLDNQPPVGMVLAPIGLEAVDCPTSHMQEPDLVQVYELLLVDDAKEVRGLCSLNGDLDDGGAIVADEESAHMHCKIRKRADQLLEIRPSHLLGVSLQVQWEQGERCLWGNR